MKANEAPEKIYISKDLFRWSFNEPQSKSDIEYIRTDAFIEKALKWLEENVMKYLITTIHAGMDVPDIKNEFFDDFKNYMKGE